MSLNLYEVGDNEKERELLSAIYDNPEVEEGITSGCGYRLDKGWYLSPQYHHVVFSVARYPTIVGTIFYELLDKGTTARVHVNFLPGYRSPRVTNEGGVLFMEHMVKKPNLYMLEGIIPDSNRAAQRFALRMGWERAGTMWSPIPGNVTVFLYPLIGELENE